MNKKDWLGRLAETNKELLLSFSIIAFAALINFLIVGQQLILTFYNIPTLFAAYYFGRRRAVQTAVASILIVVWLNVLNPAALVSNRQRSITQVMGWTDVALWAGFLLLTAYALGTLYEHKERSLRELRETYYGLLEILSQFVSKDKYTHHHSYRVSIYAAQIARHMGLPPDQIEDIRAASLLHDIGKLQTSREILYKAARLTGQEIEDMKAHVEKGIRFLSPVGGSLRRVLPIILAHHDKFDGSGHHPTQGEAIPMEARIITVADAYDSMVSDRPYRKGLSPFEVRDIIVKGAGTDFDPHVVAAFEVAFRQREMEIPEGILLP
jgi:putative nucleotidyltransferase with HDIG domain